MSNLDYFELASDGNFYINNRSLINIVKEIEITCIAKECEEYSPEDDENSYSVAGDYIPLPIYMIKFPSRYLLDEPKDFTYGINTSNPMKSKTTLLGCKCGIIECWFLSAKISLTESKVTWSDFQNFYRDNWEYNLSFTFDRKQYELQLNKIYI